MDKNALKIKIRDFLQKYEYKIILFIGFILIAVISFEAGILKGSEMKQEPIIIEKPAEIAVNNEVSAKMLPEAQNSLPEVKGAENSPNNIKQNCAFVGSKNSNKYHLPTCRWAKNIKPENLICFSDENQAKSKGYLPDKNCIK